MSRNAVANEGWWQLALLLLAWSSVFSCGGQPQAPTPLPSVSPTFSPPPGWTTLELGDAGVARSDHGFAIISPVQVAASRTGTAMAVWVRQSPDGPNEIWASRMAGGRWGPAARIPSTDVGDPHAPQVALDDLGNAMVVWASRAPSSFRWTPWAAHLVGNTWVEGGPLDEASAPRRLGSALSPSVGLELAPKVGVDADGNAVAVWIQTPPGQGAFFPESRLAAARFTPDGGWEPAFLLGPPTTGLIHPQLAVSGSGEAFALWDAGGIWTARLPAGTRRWQSPLQLESIGSDSAVSVDRLGNAVAIWSGAGLSGSYYVGRWRPPQIITPAVVVDVRVAIEGGTAMALWVDYQDRRLFASRSAAPDVWESPVVLGEWADQSGVPLSTNVVVTPHGTAVAAWPSRSNSPFQITVRRFEAGRWSEPEAVSAQANLLPHTRDSVGMTTLGDRSVLVSWAEVDRSMRLRAFVSRYDFDRP